MCGMPRVQKAWKEQYYGNLFAGYDLVQDKEAVAKRQYASHKVIFDACVSGDCEAICKAIRIIMENHCLNDARSKADAPQLELG